jgi:hypothetical protein
LHNTILFGILYIMKMTISGYARKHKVSRQLVRQWIDDGRIIAENPATGVWLIDSKQLRPKRKQPWEDSRNERLERESLA